jgi:hypothetical protein
MSLEDPFFVVREYVYFIFYLPFRLFVSGLVRFDILIFSSVSYETRINNTSALLTS